MHGYQEEIEMEEENRRGIKKQNNELKKKGKSRIGMNQDKLKQEKLQDFLENKNLKEQT